MIIRSGLIRNRPGVEADSFRRHWRDVHGPLAALLPNLRAYAQNLVFAARRDLRESGLHPIDGISQLWFDDLAAMETGMSSPQNAACVRDIAGFLAEVTIAVQDPARWHGPAQQAGGTKVMAVHTGSVDVAGLEAVLLKRNPVCRWRLNPVARRGFIVDPTIPRSEEAVTAVYEAWFADASAAEDALTPAYWIAAEFCPAMVGVVKETVILPLSSQSGQD
jgi:uncharacterized protein (TIGR02118 family)